MLPPRARKTIGQNGKHDPSPSNPRAPATPDGLDLVAWDRWLSYRKGIGKAIKPPSVEAAQRAMAALGAGQAAAVEHSIANGWQGLFASKDAAGVRQRPMTLEEATALEDSRVAS